MAIILLTILYWGVIGLAESYRLLLHWSGYTKTVTISTEVVYQIGLFMQTLGVCLKNRKKSIM